MRVQERSPWNLTHSELLECKKLTLPHGTMQSTLIDAIYQKIGRVFYLKDTDGKIVAWSLVIPTGTIHSYYTAMFYVHTDHRRHGYGSQMLRIIRRRYPEVTTHFHDQASMNFFAPTNRKAYPLGLRHGHNK